MAEKVDLSQMTPDEVIVWMKRITSLGEVLADFTNNKTDDKVIAFMKVLTNEVWFAGFLGAVMKLIEKGNLTEEQARVMFAQLGS